MDELFRNSSINVLLLLGFSISLEAIVSPELRHENPHIWPPAHIRKSSFPYPSQDTFRSIANIFVDETHTPFEFSDLKDGSIIFVSRPYISWFFNHVAPGINTKYILVSTCHDESSPKEFEPYLSDTNLVAWFVQNMDLKHPKVYPVPIGIASTYWPHGDIAIVNCVRNLNLPKEHLLYVNINTSTYPQERVHVHNYFSNMPFSYIGGKKSFQHFLIDLKKSKFVLSPRGNGLDCHRTWEALLMGSYPITRRSSISSIFDDLPVVIIDEWTEVTEEFLNDTYLGLEQKRINGKFNYEKIFAAYWINKIRSIQNEIKQ